MSDDSECPIDLAIYVGALDYFWEGEWLPGPPMPELPPGVTLTILSLKDEREEGRKGVTEWRDRLTTELCLSAPLHWDEADPRYVLATPGRICWTALQLWAAYAELKEAPPMMQEGHAGAPLVFKRLQDRRIPSRFEQFLLGISYWLPASFEIVYQGVGPYGSHVLTGSSVALLAQLNALNDQTWQADQETIEQWSSAGAPVDGRLESQARYGFAELLIATQHALDRGMPMSFYFDTSTFEDADEDL